MSNALLPYKLPRSISVWLGWTLILPLSLIALGGTALAAAESGGSQVAEEDTNAVQSLAPIELFGLQIRPPEKVYAGKSKDKRSYYATYGVGMVDLSRDLIRQFCNSGGAIYGMATNEIAKEEKTEELFACRDATILWVLKLYGGKKPPLQITQHLRTLSSCIAEAAESSTGVNQVIEKSLNNRRNLMPSLLRNRKEKKAEIEEVSRELLIYQDLQLWVSTRNMDIHHSNKSKQLDKEWNEFYIKVYSFAPFTLLPPIFIKKIFVLMRRLAEIFGSRLLSYNKRKRTIINDLGALCNWRCNAAKSHQLIRGIARRASGPKLYPDIEKMLLDFESGRVIPLSEALGLKV